jgi:hypothetical protein
MSGAEFDSLEQTESGAADAANAPSACVALVPILPSLKWAQPPSPPLSRPDPCFLTQLIATAEHAPQTRTLRRATAADAQAAYRFVTDHNDLTPTGMLTQQDS